LIDLQLTFSGDAFVAADDEAKNGHREDLLTQHPVKSVNKSGTKAAN